MIEKSLGIWVALSTAIAMAVGSILRVWSGVIFVKKADFKEHCEDMRRSCNTKVCLKIDRLDDKMTSFVKSMSDKVDLMNTISNNSIRELRKGQSDVKSELSKIGEKLANISGSFEQYVEDNKINPNLGGR